MPPRDDPQDRRGVHRPARSPGEDDRRSGRRMRRFPVRLHRRGRRGGAARARPGRGDRRKARAARQVRIHVPGRRRPGGDRNVGDHPRGEPGGEPLRGLREQHHVRDDRRPDGADHHAGPEDLHHPVRPRFPRRRLPDPDGGAVVRTRRDGLFRARRGFDTRPDTEGEGGGPEGVRDADQRDGVLHRRVPVHLSHELGDEAAGRAERVLGEMSEYFPLGVYKERKQADFA